MLTFAGSWAKKFKLPHPVPAIGDPPWSDQILDVPGNRKGAAAAVPADSAVAGSDVERQHLDSVCIRMFLSAGAENTEAPGGKQMRSCPAYPRGRARKESDLWHPGHF
jgi:hypothetical protein